MDVDGTNNPVTRQKALNDHLRGVTVDFNVTPDRRVSGYHRNSNKDRLLLRESQCIGIPCFVIEDQKVCKRYLCINEVNNNTTSRIRKSVETEPALVHSAKIHYVNSCFLLEHGDNKEGGAIYEHIKSFTFVQ
eukprot:Pgem_evm1s11532